MNWLSDTGLTSPSASYRLYTQNILQVKTWFQNRRAKWRRVRKDGDDEEDIPPGASARSLGQIQATGFHYASRF